MKRKLTKILSLIIAVILLTGSIFTNDVQAAPSYSKTLSINCYNVQIKVGSSDTIEPWVNSTSGVNYSFSLIEGSEYITLNANTGKVTGIAAGTAKVLVTGTKGSKTGTKEVTVTVTDRTYSHVSIAVNAVDEDENNSGYYLASKPTIVANGGYYTNRTISLKSANYSSHNGYEYQSDSGFTFSSSTVFTITATLTDGKNSFTKTFNVSDVPNYKNSGMTFYAYCAKEFCEDNTGIDMKLSYNDIVEYFYDVVYDCDGDTMTYTDSEEYSNGETVIVKDFAPSKDGYEFIGWEYNGTIYTNGMTVTVNEGQITFTAVWAKLYNVTYNVDGNTTSIKDTNAYRDGDTVTLTSDTPTKTGYRFVGWEYDGTTYTSEETVEIDESNIEFVAKWEKQYNISFYVDGTLVGTKTYDEGTDVSDYLSYPYTVDDSKNMTAWSVTTTGANVEAIDKDIRVDATTSTKEYNVYYYVDGVEYESFSAEYGTDFDVNDITYSDDSKIFSGWTVTSGDPSDVKSDVIINGTTTDKYFTVTYKVDGKVVNTENSVKYGTAAANYVYTPVEGYDFSGFTMETEGGDLSDVKQNLVLTGTTSIKTFTVTFKDYNGDIISEETFDYDSQVTLPANPTRADDKTEDGVNAATWFKYSFKAWSADSADYSIENLNKVTQNMTFTATYTKSEVKVKYYVLNRGKNQPSELDHYEASGYSKGQDGSLFYFKEISNNDSAVAANLAKIPTGKFKLYNSNTDLTLNDGEYIKWYVIKKESDNWHVDGIIMNQMYNVTINYVNSDGDKLADSYTGTAAATSSVNIASPTIEGYSLADETQSNISITMPYGDYTVDVVYNINSYDLTIHYVYSDGTKAADDYTDTLKYNEAYSVTTSQKTGYTVDKDIVKGNMPANDLEVTVTYTINTHTLTINYLYENKATAAESKVIDVDYDEAYNVASPVITGYTCSLANVVGTMPDDDVTVDVYYTINSHTLTINYYDHNNALLSSYSDTLDYDEPYSIDTPTIKGSTPDKATVSGNMPDENVVENVYYSLNEHDLLIHYVYDNGETVRADYSATLKYGDTYDIDSEAVEGYTADLTEVTGTMDDTDIEVTVTYNINSHNLTINYVDNNGETLAANYSHVYDYNESYEVPSPELTGYTCGTPTVTGTMIDEDVVVTVEYTPISYDLTIVYEYADGSQAATSYTASVPYKEAYSVTSPVITGFTSSDSLVEGHMPAEDLEIKVLYAKNNHFLTINYYDNNGNKVDVYTDTLDYDDDYEVETPDKTGYTPDRDVVEGTMGDEDIVEDVIYNINSYDLTIHYEYEDGSEASADYEASYNYNQTYSVLSPTIEGYTPDTSVVAGVMEDEDKEVTVVYKANEYELNVKYIYSDNSEAAKTATSTVAYGQSYSVDSPVITGFTPNDASVTGIMPNANVNLVVMYTRNTHTVTVYYEYEDGTTIGNEVIEVLYDDEYSIPSSTIKGYTPDKTVVEGTMGDEDIEETVVYSINSHNLTVHYEYADGTTAEDDYSETVDYDSPYSVNSPVITGYTADQVVVSGTMDDEDVEVTVVYNINSYNLTVHYVYADNSEADSDSESVVEYAQPYTVVSPVINGYTASQNEVSGVMPAQDVELTVMYTVNTHTVTVNYEYEDGSVIGNKVIEVNFDDEYSVTTDPITGFTPDIEVVEGTMGDENIVETVVYNRNSHNVTVHYVYANGSEASEDAVIEVSYEESFSITTPAINGYTADKNIIADVMADEDMEYTVTYTANRTPDVEGDKDNTDVNNNNNPSRKPEVEADEDVNTGDSTNPFLMFALCAASGTAITVTAKKKSNKKEA